MAQTLKYRGFVEQDKYVYYVQDTASIDVDSIFEGITFSKIIVKFTPTSKATLSVNIKDPDDSSKTYLVEQHIVNYPDSALLYLNRNTRLDIVGPGKLVLRCYRL